MFEMIEELNKPTVKNIILDTDQYNEVDDQFALAYALLSPDRVQVVAVNAAPFLNSRVNTPEEGMEKSYEEIFRTLERVNPIKTPPVYKGSKNYLTAPDIPQRSEAADEILRIVRQSLSRVWIVSIGAITNVASAILKEPNLMREKAAIIWLGGHALTWHDTKEFNMAQDIYASRVVLNSGIPLVQIPCYGVCSEFRTTMPELRYYLENQNPLCDYFLEMMQAYSQNKFGWSKVLWDIVAVAALVKPNGLDRVCIPTPILTDDARYAFDFARHLYIYVQRVNRDMIYSDVFRKLRGADHRFSE